MDDDKKDANPFDWWDDRSLPVKMLLGLGIVCLVLCAIAAVFLIVMALWNALMPDIFGLKRLTFLQAAGLSVLCYILFQGPGRGSSGSRGKGGEWRRKRDLRRYLREAESSCAARDGADGMKTGSGEELGRG
jgi:hypothetical protein